MTPQEAARALNDLQHQYGREMTPQDAARALSDFQGQNGREITPQDAARVLSVVDDQALGPPRSEPKASEFAQFGLLRQVARYGLLPDMASADKTLQELEKEVSMLKLLVEELEEENRDFREICNENNVWYEEKLAVRRHKRYFAHLCAGHPIETTATESDLSGAVLCAEKIVRKIAEYASSEMRPALISRDFHAEFTQLATQFPWKFGGRVDTTLEGRRDSLFRSKRVSRTDPGVRKPRTSTTIAGQIVMDGFLQIKVSLS